MTKTNAIRLLERAGVACPVHEYPVDEDQLDAVSVARAIGMRPERVFKTLVTRSDSGDCSVFCIPANGELDLKKAARVAGARKIALVPLKELLPLTGYMHGGCSPVGMKKPFPTWLDESARLHETICVSAGVRGAQIEIAPAALESMIGSETADLTA